MDNKDNTFRIDFEPTTVGTHTANVFFADQEIPSSPYKIHVEPSVDVGRVVVQGLEDRKCCRRVSLFCVSTMYLIHQSPLIYNPEIWSVQCTCLFY